MKKNLFRFAIIFIPLLIVFMIVLSDHDFIFFIEKISNLNIIFTIISCILMVLYWFFESLVLYVITSFYKLKIKFKKSFLITMLGQFFNAITPFATGGQPAQVIYMSKNGFDVATSSSIVLLKFIAYQSVLTIYSIVIIILYYPYFRFKIPLLFTMTFLGLTVHASMILITLLFSLNRSIAKKIILGTFNLLKRIKFLKVKESSLYNFEDSLEKIHNDFRLFKNNPKLMIKAFILVFLQLTCYFLIPYCVYRSFNQDDANLFISLASSVFVITTISIVPLPGATGGAEAEFYLFFSLVFNKDILMLVMLIWRLITYYSCIILGGSISLTLSKKNIAPTEQSKEPHTNISS